MRGDWQVSEKAFVKIDGFQSRAAIVGESRFGDEIDVPSEILGHAFRAIEMPGARLDQYTHGPGTIFAQTA